eukprot:6569211-Heterocapsa_arctica.AAC.1
MIDLSRDGQSYTPFALCALSPYPLIWLKNWSVRVRYETQNGTGRLGHSLSRAVHAGSRPSGSILITIQQTLKHRQFGPDKGPERRLSAVSDSPSRT